MERGSYDRGEECPDTSLLCAIYRPTVWAAMCIDRLTNTMTVVGRDSE